MDRIQEEEEVRRVLLRLNTQAWGTAFGSIFGLGLFIATILLVLRGGEHVGAHLGLLAVYFPGYRVSVLGSLVGFVYGFVVGYALGRLIGLVYNRVTDAVR